METLPLHHTIPTGLNSTITKDIENIPFFEEFGKVTRIVGLIIEAKGIFAPIGTLCYIYPASTQDTPVHAEIVGFKEDSILLMPYEEMRGIMPGSIIMASEINNTFPVGNNLLGRVFDAFGNSLDQEKTCIPKEQASIYKAPPSPLERPRIDTILDVGVRSINAFLTLGKGQRVGIMAGSGVGKSTLLGMIARYTSADINVIALVGERGREVIEFIEKDLGEEGLARSILIVATSDQSPLLRMRAAYAATTVAEYFRDQGKDVLLMMDSVTRFAMAAREIGLAIGEPPTSKGYTPSVFSQLPKLLERTGKSITGSITGLYTVLVDGDDFNEPIADSVRSILDGHIVLTRELADAGHFPAIDILRSVSRVRNDIVAQDIKNDAQSLLKAYALYKQKEDMINIGAYTMGSNEDIDRAILLYKDINAFLTQDVSQNYTIDQSFNELKTLANKHNGDHTRITDTIP